MSNATDTAASGRGPHAGAIAHLRGVQGLVVAITAIGAAMRFATLDRQSFWLDELVTSSLLRLDFGSMLDAVPSGERTPYLYYVLAWGWTNAVGDGETALRSLSALVGTATIPVAYAAGASLVSRRAGVFAAALVAVNPFLVWYSQEARSYALLSFLTALSFLFFAHALEGRSHARAWWALASSLAIATHYFALPFVAAEAAWLLARRDRARETVVAVCIPALVALAHLPLALDQQRGGQGISESSLATRVVGLGKNLVVGYSFPLEVEGTVAACTLVAVGLVLGLRPASRHRHGVLVALSVVAATIGLPLLLAFVGPDYVIARNAVAAVVPAAVCVGGGFAASRLGVAAGVALCALSVAIVVTVGADTSFGRTDWRGAAAVLSAPRGDRAVVVSPSMSPELWTPYLAGLDEADSPLRVREIVVIGLATEGGFGSGAVEPPAARPRTPPKGFSVVEASRRPTLSVVRYAAGTPTVVTPEQLAALRLADAPARVFVQRAG